MNLHLALLLGYSALLIALGLWVGRLVRGSGEFFVAGRRLGAGLLFATVLAANIGAGSTVGATSLGFRDGISAWWWNGSAGIGTIVLALWVGPRIWRAAAAHGFYTVGDFLEHRYGAAVRGIVASLIWVGTLSILAGQLIGGAAVLQVVGGIPRAAGCLIGGVVMTSYFAAGGLLSAAWVNLVQLVVLLAGFGIAVPLVLSSVGGWSGLAAAPGASAGFFDIWHSTGPGSGWTLLGLLGPAFIISPGLLQKAYGASSERAIRLGIGATAFALLAFAFAPALLGMAARLRHPGLEDINLALPAILATDLPAGFGMLALASVFSAELSSADAILFMLATSLSQDLYRRFVNPAATDTQVLRVARGTALVGGVLGIALAIVIPTVIDALSIFYALLGVSLFVPVVAGLFTPRPGTAEALASIGAGIAALLATTYGTGPIGMLTPNMIGLLAAATGFALVAAGRRQRA